ncbi:DUF1810 domain-containing protein [Flavobacterium sp. UBA6031]|uniref:DUF1810 domain-containing protein n=1 Tax=Flavobacterium sp. UBA6031 TaxID=1946551 RepID=UPI0025C5A8BB|nr:DUF1810 domain-containing protein [Flavobacterium sp. UBA6031]
MNPTYNLERFLSAQESVYDTALTELQNGKKQTHWMWFIFPQLKELGFSSTAKFYGITSIAEAQAYLQHPLFRERLEECIKAVINSKAKNPIEIFGNPDHLKFHSSLTLFFFADPQNKLFKEALEKYYQGITDFETENIIVKEKR